MSASLLVVDDNELNRDMLSRRLVRRGYHVATAADGDEALQLIEAQPFDVIVLDIMMPGIDGFEVLQIVRQTRSLIDLPIVMATARDRTEDVVRALRLGANDYVSKPVDFDVLIARIETQLSMKATRAAARPVEYSMEDEDTVIVPRSATAGVGRVEQAPLRAEEPASEVEQPHSAEEPPTITSAFALLVGRYQLVERIGDGGMGSVFLARDPSLDRPVALKLLREGFNDADRRKRFAREARAVARLAHPNIVTIYDVGEHEGRPFIAMEFVPGHTLAEQIRRRADISVERRLQILEDLCAGIGHAHRANIIHRDLKPANVMTTPEGVVKILDFGIARFEDSRPADSQITGPDVLIGTINYMSPEQLENVDIDHRSDIFALGAIAYELFSYRQAFSGGLEDGVLKILIDSPEALQSVCPGLDEGLIAVIEKALEKNRIARYQNADAMRQDLAAVRRRLGDS